MVTNGGIYILQLVDNHSATYSALILGCLEVSVMAWIYGVDKFLEDLRFMLGFYPYPRLFWKWSWKISSPVIVIVSYFMASRKTFFHNPRKSFVVIILSVNCIHFMSYHEILFSDDPELHHQRLPGEQVRRLPLSGLGEHSRVVHNLLFGGVHPYSRLVQDRPRRGQPLGTHQPTYHCQVPRHN